MQFRYIIIPILLLASLSGNAQFHITPQVGYTFSSLMQKSADYTNYVYARNYNKVQPAFGILASKNLGGKFSLQTDLFYSQRGAYIAESYVICTYITEINSKHLDIGVQFAYDITDGLTIESGIYHSQLLNMIESGYGFSGKFEYDVIEIYDNETGASLGLSSTLYNITARAKYSFGLWGTREFEKHHWFLLTLGYRFNL